MAGIHWPFGGSSEPNAHAPFYKVSGGGGGSPTGPAGGDLSGEYPNPAIGEEKVVTGRLAALAVTTAKLAGEAVTTAKIAALAVTTATIAALAVTTEKIGELAVTTAKLAEGAVTAAKLAAEAVTTAAIKKEAVTNEKLAALEWKNLEEVNASIVQTATLQAALFNGLIFLRGRFTVSAEIASGTKLWKLPGGMIPGVTRIVLMQTSISGATAGLEIKNASGECVASPALKTTGKQAIDGIVFSL